MYYNFSGQGQHVKFGGHVSMNTFLNFPFLCNISECVYNTHSHNLLLRLLLKCDFLI